MPQSDAILLNADETPLPRKRGGSILALIALLLFAGGAAALALSFRTREIIQWSPGARSLMDGKIRTRIMRYEASLSRGAVGFWLTREDWTTEAGTRPGWFHVRSRPTSLITEPLPQDRTNLRFAGFQWYHGVFPNQVAGLREHVVHILVLPLWPLLLVSAVPPWLWWRRRRRTGRGFSVAVLWGTLLSVLVIGCAGTSRPRGVPRAPGDDAQPDTRVLFFPPPMADEWTKWIVGKWEGAGAGDAGKGRATVLFELALAGQFLIFRGDSEITGLDPDYLKKHMHATDSEIDRFRRVGYHSLEVYTIDQKTGEVVGFLFDSLRCVATGRGRREGDRETIEWEWQSGHKSTRVTERVGADQMLVVERTPQRDGSVMEDRGEMTRVKQPALEKP